MIYTYKCTKCGKVFEVPKSITFADKKEYCPVCGAEGKRVYNTSPIVVKGRGTYTVSFPNKWNKNNKE